MQAWHCCDAVCLLVGVLPQQPHEVSHNRTFWTPPPPPPLVSAAAPLNRKLLTCTHVGTCCDGRPDNDKAWNLELACISYLGTSSHSLLPSWSSCSSNILHGAHLQRQHSFSVFTADIYSCINRLGCECIISCMFLLDYIGYEQALRKSSWLALYYHRPVHMRHLSLHVETLSCAQHNVR